MRGWWLALALWLVVAAGLAVPMAAHAQTYTSNYIWDANRRLVMVIAPDTGTGVLLATQYTYDSDGQLTQVQHGTTTSTTGSPFTAVETTTYTYDAGGRKTETTVLNGTYTNSTAHPALSLTQVDYDADDRPTCTATRLAPAGTLPTSACTQSSGGQDPISQTVYDADGRVQQVNEGVGTSIAITYAAYGYDANSFKTSITDARTNATTLNPDGFNRLASTAYPDATTEVNTYDAKGQVIAWTNRGGFTVNRTYDAMGNLDTEAGASGNLTARSWDLQPRKFFYNLLSERVAADNSLVYYGWTYDNAGRPSEYYDMWGGHPFQYDAAGNLTNMFGSVGYVTTYTYDSLNHMTTASVERPGVDSSPQLAATLTYDSLGRRSLVTFADNSTQAYTYDNADRPLTIAHTFPGSGSGDPGDAVTYTYAYDAAGRDTSKTITNPLGTLDPGYVFTASGGAAPASTYAAANTVNQYATVNGQTYTYWQEGQMYWDGIPARAYDYDELGSMIWATKSSTDYANTPVDALGRPIWRQKMNPGGTDTFIYYGTSGLGPEEITEVVFDAPDPATSWTNRGWRYYLPGPAPDERLAFVDTNNVVYYPHIDRQGSTIAVSNAGYAVAKHAYGPYGETPDPVIEDVPASSGAAVGAEAYPFRYTGQRLHSDYGLYDYKARNYNPVIGQFLQPDPIGFGGGMNFYGYVGDDPTNETDPTGTEGNHADNGNGSTMPDAMDEENLSVWKGTQVYKAIEDERSGTSGDSLSKLSTATGESSQSIAKNDPSPSDVVAAAIATAASPQTDEIVVTAEKAPLDVAQCGFCHTDNQSLPVRPPLRCQFMPCFPGRDWKIPRPAPVTSSKADRAEALKRCREKCAREVGQGKWGPRGIGGSAVPSNLRKCVRNCLEAEGYRDY